VAFPALISLMNDKTVEVIYFEILYMHNIFIFLMFFALFVSFTAHFGIIFLLNFFKINGWQAFSHPIDRLTCKLFKGKLGWEMYLRIYLLLLIVKSQYLHDQHARTLLH